MKRKSLAINIQSNYCDMIRGNFVGTASFYKKVHSKESFGGWWSFLDQRLKLKIDEKKEKLI